jgi:hypothetical protein
MNALLVGGFRRHSFRLVVLAVAFVLAGCALGSPASGSRSAPRARCLSSPSATDDQRPLFFLFCVESP